MQDLRSDRALLSSASLRNQRWRSSINRSCNAHQKTSDRRGQRAGFTTPRSLRPIVSDRVATTSRFPKERRIPPSRYQVVVSYSAYILRRTRVQGVGAKDVTIVVKRKIGLSAKEGWEIAGVHRRIVIVGIYPPSLLRKRYGAWEVGRGCPVL